ncbi:MAG: hypothetical protein E7163_02220 [Firmicutes bacterium]|nr:hypothetical protein [Bacillota bacterium]
MEEIYNVCSIMKIECIKNEVENILSGYVCEGKLLNGFRQKEIIFNKGGYKATVNLQDNSITILIVSKNGLERIKINDDLILNHEILKSESDKFIFTVVNKVFCSSKRFGNKVVLSDLSESKYILLKNKNLSKYNITLNEIYVKIKNLNIKRKLSGIATICSNFSVHMNFYYPGDGGREIVAFPGSTRTEFNGEDVSYLYDIIDGEDKIYRIYDLYRGVINSRNVQDINAIRLGIMPSLGFNLWNKKYMDAQEEFLLSSCAESMSEDKEKVFSLRLAIKEINK